MKLTKVSADVLDAPPKQRGLTPRQVARLELERSLEKAIRDAHADKAAAFRLRLEDGEKPTTIRSAFNRVKSSVGLAGVNLFKIGDDLVVAAREQRRGRRPGAAS
jgi:hypothetical protein